MAQIYTKQRLRCTEHPHREADERCSRCGRPFCTECLTPGERRLDGTRGWYCPACQHALAESAAQAAEARTLEGQVRRVRERSRVILPAAGALVALVALATTWLLILRPRPEQQSTCGELSRIRSVGGIGLVGPAEVVNALTYPNRAAVSIAGGAAGTGAGSPAGSTSGTSDPSALVDECETGWRSDGPAQLPLTLVFDVQREAVWMQRIVLWQDPTAPHSAWVREIQLLASPSASGDDFQPLLLDRPSQLAASVEQQWFQVLQPPPPGGVSPAAMPPEERARYAQSFPAVVPMRRLMVRILSTWADSPPDPRRVPVALGEVAVYGADLEVEARDRESDGAKTGDWFFSTGIIAGGARNPASAAIPELRALTGRPVSVLFTNHSTTSAHTFVTFGQDRNLSLRAEPGQAVSGTFIAASRAGRYEFSCTLPGHSLRGLTGSIIVR